MKLLVVGAGGIGCELLKNLAMDRLLPLDDGLVTIIDLDAIEVSNLNRQLLFRKKDVGRFKADVAAEKCRELRPRTLWKAISIPIQDSSLTSTFWKQFDAVFNALDNLDARKFVNQQCVIHSLPLLDGGTEAMVGQAQVCNLSGCECYECVPKGGKKSFPVCSIRDTPTKWAHCVIWAKHVFSLVYGTGGDLVAKDYNIDLSANAVDRFDRLFHHNIQTKIQQRRQQQETKPEPEDGLLSTYSSGDESVMVAEQDGLRARQTASAPAQQQNTPPLFPVRMAELLSPAAQHAASELDLSAVDVFTATRSRSQWGALYLAANRRLEEEGGGEYNRDNISHQVLVGSLSYFRAICHSVTPESIFKATEIAGNIVPAVATSNAIVSALLVLQLRALQHPTTQHCAKSIAFLRKNGDLKTMKQSGPNPSCPVCSRTNIALHVSEPNTSLSDLCVVLSNHPQIGAKFKDWSLVHQGSVLIETEDDVCVDGRLDEFCVDGQGRFHVFDADSDSSCTPPCPLVLMGGFLLGC